MTALERLAFLRERFGERDLKPAKVPPPPSPPVTVELAADDLRFIKRALEAGSRCRVLSARSRRRARLLVDQLAGARR